MTHSNTSLLNCLLLLPRNSPIICRLKPFLCNRKWATPIAVSGIKPLDIKNWIPLSGFLQEDQERCRWVLTTDSSFSKEAGANTLYELSLRQLANITLYNILHVHLMKNFFYIYLYLNLQYPLKVLF